MKNENNIEKKKKERNPFKIATIVLAIILLSLIVFDKVLEERIENKIEEENRLICNKIEATPAWVDSWGNIIQYGLLSINESNMDFSNNLTNFLIENKIKFVYNHNCGYCNLQINIFGEDNFNKLKENNLALDCANIN